MRLSLCIILYFYRYVDRSNRYLKTFLVCRYVDMLMEIKLNLKLGQIPITFSRYDKSNKAVSQNNIFR